MFFFSDILGTLKKFFKKKTILKQISLRKKFFYSKTFLDQEMKNIKISGLFKKLNQNKLKNKEFCQIFYFEKVLEI